MKPRDINGGNIRWSLETCVSYPLSEKSYIAVYHFVVAIKLLEQIS